MTSPTHTDPLRLMSGLPACRTMYGADAGCIRAGQPIGRIRSLDDALEACAALGLRGPERVHLVDDLLAHGEYRAAFDLASVVAVDPLFDSTQDEAHHLQPEDLGAIVTMRLLAAVAAIQGGLYRRAYSSLIQARHVLQRLRCCNTREAFELTIDVLFCRLAQGLALPQRALEFVAALEARKSPTLVGLPLLKARSELDHDPATALDTLNDGRVVGELDRPDHILGHHARYYFHYFMCRASLDLGDWDKADSELSYATERLALLRHLDHEDTLRYAFLKIAGARIKIGRTRSLRDGVREFDQGRKMLREAIYAFRREQFTPGEYVASKYLVQTDEPGPATAERIRAARDVYSLARASNILRFQADAAVIYAHLSLDYGRPNAVHAALGPFSEPPPPFMRELSSSPTWKEANRLFNDTRDAIHNGIDPLAMWGMSRYARDELDFVKTVVGDRSAIATASGLPGSGRRILLERISRARQPDQLPRSSPATWLHVIAANPASPFDTVNEFKAQLKAGSNLVLLDFDLWGSDAQARACTVMSDADKAAADWRQRVYVTLTDSFESALINNRLVPACLDFIQSRFACTIEPLEKRREDTLLLARGFLVTALYARGAFETLQEAKQVIFSSDAAKHIYETHSHIGRLYKTMLSVASQLRPAFDIYDSVDSYTSYKTVSLDVIRRLTETTTMESEDSPVAAGRDLLHANADQVRELAKRYRGRLSALAADVNIARATLIRSWKERGLMDIWYEEGGRRLSRD